VCERRGAGRSISREHFGVSIGYAREPIDPATARVMTARRREPWPLNLGLGHGRAAREQAEREGGGQTRATDLGQRGRGTSASELLCRRAAEHGSCQRRGLVQVFDAIGHRRAGDRDRAQELDGGVHHRPHERVPAGQDPERDTDQRGEAEALEDAPPGEERQSPGAPIAGRVDACAEFLVD
jgi:hypothetical protein